MTSRSSAGVLLATLLVLAYMRTAVADVVHVSDRPACIYEHRYTNAAVVATASPGVALQVLERNGDWVRVVAPPDAGAAGGRAGWISVRALAPRSPARPKAREGNAAPSGRKNAGPGTTGGTPPDPFGRTGQNGSSPVADWILPRALRASVGFTFESADVSQSAGALADRLFAGSGTVTTSFAILDPRILNIDFTGDFQASRATSDAALASFRNTSGLQSYRVSMGVLSGRSAPLQLYADRVSSASSLQPLGDTLDPARPTHGLRKGAGFNWDLEIAPLWPHIQVSASTARQLDERNYVFGYSSTNAERRAELRMSREHGHGRYDIDFAHGEFQYDVPAAGVRTDTANDLFLATTRLSPFSRLTVDLGARASRFSFAAGSQASTVRGAGGDGTVRYEFARHLALSGRYAFSSNAFEAALSGRLTAAQPGASPVTTASQLATRTFFQDGEGRVEYFTRPFTAALVAKNVSFGVPWTDPPTLSRLTTGGLSMRTEQVWRGLAFSASVDGAAGTARSNRNQVEPYREAGLEAGVARNVGRAVRFGLDASGRRIGRLSFYPVNLESRNTSARFETMRPGWARVRASVTRFDTLRDVMVLDARDVRLGYTIGLGASWYDLAADINQADTASLLLAPGVLGSRPDVAILVVSQPTLFRNLLAARDRTRLFSVQLRPLTGLQLQVRVRRQDQQYADLFGFDLRGAQAWATWQMRDLQLELGWEEFVSATSFGTVNDRRVFVRIRRDAVFF